MENFIWLLMLQNHQYQLTPGQIWLCVIQTLLPKSRQRRVDFTTPSDVSVRLWSKVRPNLFKEKGKLATITKMKIKLIIWDMTHKFTTLPLVSTVSSPFHCRDTVLAAVASHAHLGSVARTAHCSWHHAYH